MLQSGQTPLIPFSDYSRWERRRTKQASANASHSESLEREKQQDILIPTNHHHKLAATSETTENKIHGQRYNVMLKTARNRPRIRLSTKHYEPARIRMLKSQLDIRKPSVGVYHAYISDLYADNVSIIHSIVEAEDETFKSTNRVLDKYQHFKGTIATLKRKSNEILEQAKYDLEKTRSKLNREMEISRARVVEIDDVLEKNLRQLQVLRQYKDKHFPVNVIKIEELKEQVVEMRANQEDELEELKRQVVEEMEVYEQQMMSIKVDMEIKATKASLDTTKRSIEAKAVQNKIMSKEIELHRRTRNDLQKAISGLKSAIARMRMEARLHREKVPSFYPTSNLLSHIQFNKCLPDTEIILNIPTQEKAIPV